MVRSVFGLLILMLFFFCDNSQKTEEAVVATIGDREITIDEFRSFYSFDVNFGLDSSGYNTLRDELLFFIDQIKARKKAETDGLLQDSLFIRSYEWEKRQAMLRQLFREKISENISVSEKETRDLFRKRQVQVRFRHLFYKSMDEAGRAYNLLSHGETFENLALEVFKDDSLARSAGELGWIKLSDLDDELSDSVYMLPPRTISQPLKSKWGYHIVEVLDKRQNPIITEADYQASMPSLTKKIRTRKSQQRSLEYISRYIGQLNPQLVAKMFIKVWNSIIPINELERSVLSAKIVLNQHELEKLHHKLRTELDQPFIVYRNGHITLKTFLDGIMKIPVSHKFAFKSRRELSDHIGRWVRDELLLKVAYNEQYDEHERVIAETKRFIEEQCYYYYQSIISDTMQVPESVAVYFAQRGSALRHDIPFLARYNTLQEWKFEQSKRILKNSLKTIKSDININERVLQDENKKVDWDTKLRMFMIRKPS